MFSAITKFRVVMIWNTLFIVIPEVTLNRLSETSYQCNIVVKGTRIWMVWKWGFMARNNASIHTYTKWKAKKLLWTTPTIYLLHTFTADKESYTKGVYFFTFTHLYQYMYIFLGMCVCVCVSVISIWRYCLQRYRLCYNVYMIVKQKRQKAQWTKKKVFTMWFVRASIERFFYYYFYYCIRYPSFLPPLFRSIYIYIYIGISPTV